MNDIKFDPVNARKHGDRNKETIKASLTQCGAGRLIVMDADNVIIGGNGVFEQAKEMGLKVRVIESDGSELVVVKRTDLKTGDDKRKLLALADNRTAELAEWDTEALEKLIAEMPELDLSSIGFDEKSLLDIGIEPEHGEADAEPQINKCEELNKKWKVKAGDLFTIGDHRLLCGDSTSEKDVKKLLQKEVPLLMVTDPPYGVEYDANWRNKAARNSKRMGKRCLGAGAVGKVMNDDKCDWRKAWALFPGDAAYIWHAGRHASEVQASIESAGFEIRCQLIWAKQHFAIGRGDYHWQHEPCWYAVRKGKTAHYNGDRTQSTLWEIEKPVSSETGHSTQKPLECMARPIRNNSVEGGGIYEPFSGSGTTIVAAQNLNRKCYGMELNPDYCAVILQRMTDAFPGIEIKKVNP